MSNINDIMRRVLTSAKSFRFTGSNVCHFYPDTDVGHTTITDVMLESMLKNIEAYVALNPLIHCRIGSDGISLKEVAALRHTSDARLTDWGYPEITPETKEETKPETKPETNDVMRLVISTSPSYRIEDVIDGDDIKTVYSFYSTPVTTAKTITDAMCAVMLKNVEKYVDADSVIVSDKTKTRYPLKCLMKMSSADRDEILAEWKPTPDPTLIRISFPLNFATDYLPSNTVDYSFRRSCAEPHMRVIVIKDASDLATFLSTKKDWFHPADLVYIEQGRNNNQNRFLKEVIRAHIGDTIRIRQLWDADRDVANQIISDIPRLVRVWWSPQSRPINYQPRYINGYIVAADSAESADYKVNIITELAQLPDILKTDFANAKTINMVCMDPSTSEFAAVTTVFNGFKARIATDPKITTTPDAAQFTDLFYGELRSP